MSTLQTPPIEIHPSQTPLVIFSPSTYSIPKSPPCASSIEPPSHVHTSKTNTPANAAPRETDAQSKSPPRTSASACRKCYQNITQSERYRDIANYYDGVKHYLRNRLELNAYDRDILRPQIRKIAEEMDKQKFRALDELKRRLEMEEQKRNEFSEVEAGWI